MTKSWPWAPTSTTPRQRAGLHVAQPGAARRAGNRQGRGRRGGRSTSAAPHRLLAARGSSTTTWDMSCWMDQSHDRAGQDAIRRRRQPAGFQRLGRSRQPAAERDVCLCGRFRRLARRIRLVRRQRADSNTLQYAHGSGRAARRAGPNASRVLRGGQRVDQRHDLDFRQSARAAHGPRGG